MPDGVWFPYFNKVLDDSSEPPLPPEPTEHLAQSPEKIEVIRWRVENGYQPYHPLDAKGRYVGTSTDCPCIRIIGSIFRVETHRTVDGKRKRFSKDFTIMNDALDWLDWLNDAYPVSRKAKSD